MIIDAPELGRAARGPVPPNAQSRACSLYGLGLEYDKPLAALEDLAAPSRIDVRLSMGDMPARARRPGKERIYYTSPHLDIHGASSMHVRLCDERYFRIDYSDHNSIALDVEGIGMWATWPESATIEDTATYVLGAPLAFMLRLRGITCLHASAIAHGNRAIALVGQSGAGKSSTAAGFAQLGHPILSDDVVALRDCEDSFEVQPGYPRLRVWPKVAAALFGSADTLPRITPGWEKRYVDLTEPAYRFQREALPLAAVYVMGERAGAGADTSIEALSPAAAVIQLVATTHANYLLDAARRAQEFDLLSRLVEAVPVRLVTPSADIGSIHDLCRRILADVEA